MDSERFDSWTKNLAKRRSRRGVIGILMGGVVAVVTRRRASAQLGEPGGMCGGIAGIPCPEGFECVDASDGCDPMAGGADCSGICLPIDYNPCAAILCIEGTTCCPQCGGICVPAGVPCSEELCVGEPCGPGTCGPDEYCCDESCGFCESCSRCIGLGESCPRPFCPPAPSAGEPCGTSVCGPGEYCCNESCGICAPLGDGCIAMYCEPPAPGIPCGPTTCPSGQVCCNESCGICTPPGGVCIMLACVD